CIPRTKWRRCRSAPGSTTLATRGRSVSGRCPDAKDSATTLLSSPEERRGLPPEIRHRLPLIFRPPRQPPGQVGLERTGLDLLDHGRRRLGHPPGGRRHVLGVLPDPAPSGGEALPIPASCRRTDWRLWVSCLTTAIACPAEAASVCRTSAWPGT